MQHYRVDSIYHFPLDAVVSLEMTSYEVMENVGVVEVCATVSVSNGNITCPIDLPFNVSLSTADDSAGNIDCHNLYCYLCIFHASKKTTSQRL